jgi:hypothetical protein
MAHHHKSNRAVEGDPDTGHSRGMPERPDQEQMEVRTEGDRREVAAAGGSRVARVASETHIATWTDRLVREAPELPQEKAENFVHDLYFGAQRALDKEVWEADFEREE